MAKATRKAATKSETPKVPVKRTRKPKTEAEPQPEQAQVQFDWKDLLGTITSLPRLYLIGVPVLVLFLSVMLARGCNDTAKDNRKVQELTEKNERLKAQLDSIAISKRVSDSIATVALIEADLAHAETQEAITDRSVTRSEGEAIRQKVKQRTDETAKQIENADVSQLDVILDSLLHTRRLKKSLDRR